MVMTVSELQKPVGYLAGGKRALPAKQGPQMLGSFVSTY